MGVTTTVPSAATTPARAGAAGEGTAATGTTTITVAVAGVEEDIAITIAVDVAPLAAAVAVRDIAGAVAAGESFTGDENILVVYPAVPSRVSLSAH